MVDNNDIICIVYECTCSKSHNECGYEPEEKFIIIDTDGDPNFYCEKCSAEGNHLPPITNKAKEGCWRCRETGKYKDSKCPVCDGTGVIKRTHRLKVIGRVSKDDLVELAKKDPRGWYE